MKHNASKTNTTVDNLTLLASIRIAITNKPEFHNSKAILDEPSLQHAEKFEKVKHAAEVVGLHRTVKRIVAGLPLHSFIGIGYHFGTP